MRLQLSSPSNTVGPQKVLGRVVSLREKLHFSLTLKYTTRDETQNLVIDAVEAWLREHVGTMFRSGLLGTTTRDWQLVLNKSGDARLVAHKPAETTPPSRAHDQKRSGFLDASANDWLIGLGVMGRDGKLRASMADKFRQINRYLEIVSHLARECGWNGVASDDAAGGESRAAETSGQATLHFADMGCGKGYLTFGLWHLFAREWKQPVRVTGVESRAELVTTTDQLARQIGADGLRFVRGEINSTAIEPADGLIALHACNTATDDAIRRGIEWGSKLIIVAPCCHKEVRPQLGKPEPFAAILQHGLMAERMAEWATDGLRALFLEWAGYRTKIMEFVGSEHTPKNVMIAAVRESEAFSDAGIREKIVALKTFLGIERHALDSLLHPEKTEI